MSDKFKFSQTSKTFAESTTIHGPIYIYKTKVPVKVLWIVVWFLMLSFVLYFSTKSIYRYYRYDIQTTMIYNTVPDLELPAITFCNQFFLRTTVRSEPVVLGSYIMLFNKDLEKYNTVLNQSKTSCNANFKGVRGTMSLDDILGKSIVEIAKIFYQDSFKNVVQCWWGGKSIDCSGMFANSLLDFGMCFTLVTRKDVAQSFKSEGISNLAYGINDTVINEANLVNNGLKNGVRLLINTRQSEHCDAVKKYEGAGFLVFVHDHQNIFPLYDLSPSFTLNPGYAINVILKPTVFQRRTAELGFCKMPIYSYANQSTYFKELCILSCLIRRITSECKCNPSVLTRGTESFLKTVLNLDVSKLDECTGSESMLCTHTQLSQTTRSNNLKDTCPECLQPCFETKYDFLVSQNIFPNKRDVNYFLHLSNTSSVKEFRKNYLLVNFEFESMSVLTVFENRDFTISDLFIFIGGEVGLFLGMSFLSFGDIFQFLSFIMYRLFQKCFRWKSKKKNRVIPIRVKKVRRIQIGMQQISHKNVSVINVKSQEAKAVCETSV